MSNKDIPVVFASSLAVAGPTSDGMVHITFLRQGMGQKIGPGEGARQDGFSSRAIKTESATEEVATIIFPYGRFKALGRIFTHVIEEIEAAQNEAKSNREREPVPVKPAGPDEE